MKLVVVGNEAECLGFSLAGVEGVAVTDEAEFVTQMARLFREKEIGVIVVADRYFTAFSHRFGPEQGSRAVPAVVFIPSIDKTHHEANLKEYLARILGIRL